MITTIKEFKIYENNELNIKFNLNSCGRKDWDKKILKNKQRYKCSIIYMSPDEFLNITDTHRYSIDKDKVQSILNSINIDTILPTPIIMYGALGYKQGRKTSFHDGSHRVLALKELGIKKIPVILAEDIKPVANWISIKENIDNDIKVLTLTQTELYSLIVDSKTNQYKDPTVFKRIRFFSSQIDLHANDNNTYYTVLLKGELIIGIAKVSYYSLNGKNPNTLSIAFFSIDKDYRSNKYSHLMADALFKEAKKRNKEIQTSSYTVLGKEYLQHLFNQYAKKYDVIFHDKDDSESLHDAEWMYHIINGKKLHKTQDNMQYITIDSVNEAINKENVKKYFNNSLVKINTTLTKPLKKSQVIFNISNILEIELRFICGEDKIKIDNLLKRLKQDYLKLDYIMTINSSTHHDVNISEDDEDFSITPADTYYFNYNISIKNIYNKRVAPNQYVYHYAPESKRKEILKNGIICGDFKDSEWKTVPNLEYPKAVFAVNNDKIKWRDEDCWQIDTTKCKNKWFHDLNFDNKNRPEFIMTFENIPKDAITLVNKEEPVIAENKFNYLLTKEQVCLKEGYIEWCDQTVTDKDIPLEFIKQVLEHYAYNNFILDLNKFKIKNTAIDLNLITPILLKKLKSETLIHIKEFIYLYRGLEQLDITIGNTLQPKDKIVSYSHDELTAFEFCFGDGILLKINKNDLNILFSLDVFIASISDELIEQLDKRYQKIINNYVSESEILVLDKPILLTNKNCEIILE